MAEAAAPKIAGLIGDQIAGCQNGPAVAERLAEALGLWLAAGCTGVACLNLQAIYPGADAWHHQVWGRRGACSL